MHDVMAATNPGGNGGVRAMTRDSATSAVEVRGLEPLSSSDLLGLLRA